MPHAGRAAGALELIDGATFVVADIRGDLSDDITGLFHRDSRHLSRFDLTIGGDPPELVTSELVDTYAAAFYLTNRKIDGIDEQTLTIVRRRVLARGMRERIEVSNHLDRSVAVTVCLECSADFASVTEIASKSIEPDGTFAAEHPGHGRLDLSYEEGVFTATTHINAPDASQITGSFGTSSSPPRCTISFDVEIDAHGAWSTEVGVCLDGDELLDESWIDAEREQRRIDERFEETLPDVRSSWAGLETIYERSKNDLAALRLRAHVDGREVFLPAAGMPWFMAVFGRDALIVSYEMLPFAPSLARGALTTLASLQATEFDDERDAAPGKIPHELRLGRLAVSGRRPFDPYYGSVDSTLWFLIVLSEYWRWTGDDNLVRELKGAALAALHWMETDGDEDGDGFIEYVTRSRYGPNQQSWKDSDDAMVFADGRTAEPPIATCEVQGYAYDARLRLAEIAESVWGDAILAERLRGEAEHLRTGFHDAFWIAERGHYALALDKDKQQVDSLTSNIGHLLWSGIVPDDRADALVEKLFSDLMFTGWGIRTLSTGDAKYNPISYHDGSVWPHDNAIIAMGLLRYGYREQAARLAAALLDAASRFEKRRLPELFGGYARSESFFPVSYPEAASPQGFAAAAPMLLLRAVLGLDMRDGELVVDPHLPDMFGDVKVSGIYARGTRHDVA